LDWPDHRRAPPGSSAAFATRTTAFRLRQL
jgi:hypothetical protein